MPEGPQRFKRGRGGESSCHGRDGVVQVPRTRERADCDIIVECLLESHFKGNFTLTARHLTGTLAAIASVFGQPAFAAPQQTWSLTAEQKTSSLSEASLASQELSVSREPGLNPWTGVILNAVGPAAVLATGGTLATLGGNVFGPTTALGQSSLVAGNALVFLFPIGTSAGYLYGQDPWRGLWVGLGGAGVALASATAGTVLAQHAVGGLLLDLVASTVYIGWSLFDVYRTIDSKKPVTVETTSAQ